jgi:hypothetical protein
VGAHRSSFGKLERDRAKRAKAAAKRERRQARPAGPDGEVIQEPVAGAAQARDDHGQSTADVLAELEAIHQRLERGTISQEEFEEGKTELLGRLSVD